MMKHLEFDFDKEGQRNFKERKIGMRLHQREESRSFFVVRAYS